MSFTSEYKLIKEYLDKRTEILATFDGREESEEAQKLMQQLEELYSKLLSNYHL